MIGEGVIVINNHLKGLIISVAAIITCVIAGLAFYYTRGSTDVSRDNGIVDETSGFGETYKRNFKGSSASGAEVIYAIDKLQADDSVVIRVIHRDNSVDLYGVPGVKYCKNGVDKLKKKETTILAVTGKTYDKSLKMTSSRYINESSKFESSIRENLDDTISLITFLQVGADSSLVNYGHVRPSHIEEEPDADNDKPGTVTDPDKPGKPDSGGSSESSTSEQGTTSEGGGTTSTEGVYSYTVQHHKMKLDGKTYKLVLTERMKTTDRTVTPATKVYKGFTAPKVQTVKIEKDSSTVIDYYYTRNRYWLNVDIMLDGTLIEDDFDQVTADVYIDNVLSASNFNGLFMSVYYDSSYNIRNVKPKDGYTYLGCIENKDYSGLSGNINEHYFQPNFKYKDAEVVTVVLQLSTNHYTVHYDANGGTGKMNSSSHVYDKEQHLNKNTFHRNGYTFRGWALSPKGEAKYTDEENVKNLCPDKDGEITLYAVWEPNGDIKYTIKHYKMNLDGKTYALAETEDLTGFTDEELTPPTRNYEGFIPPEKKKIKISYDGSTKLDYYYERKSFNVNLSSSDGIESVSGDGKYFYGADVSISASVKTGYTWSDWAGTLVSDTKDYSFKMPAYNVDNVANATLNNYRITYNLDGGTPAIINPDSYTVETETFTLNNPIKKGYLFVGWTGSNGDTPKISVTIPKGTTGDKSYKANYKPITYTVKYNGNGSTSGSVADSTHTYDVEKTLTPNGFTRTGYTYNGWNTKADGSGTTYSNEQRVKNLTSKDGDIINLYAKWSPRTDIPYKVQHWQQNLDGNASNHDSTNYTLKDTDSLKGTADSDITPSVKSYTGFTAPSKQTVSIKPDGTLVVNYYYTRNSYTVSLSEGTGISSVSGGGEYLYEASVSIDAIVGSGYTWSKWTGTVESSEKSYSFDMPAKNVTLIANAIANKYTVVYKGNGSTGGTMSNSEHTYDVAQKLTKNSFTRTGYTFTGWNTESNGSGTEYSDEQSVKNLVSTPNGSITLYAQWRANTYSVQYNGNGSTSGSMSASLHVYDVSKQLTKNSYARTGYTFKGWNTKIDGSGVSYGDSEAVKNLTAVDKGIVTLYAQWNVITYTISYNLAGGTDAGNPTSYSVETATFSLKAPTKVGYTFSGWTGSNGTTPQKTVSIAKGSTGDKNYTANWIPNPDTKYVVKHWCQNLDGDSSKKDSTNYTLKATDNLTGTTDSSVTPNTKDFEGFTAPSKQTVVIKPDGSLVVDYYYIRNSYTVTLTKGTGISSVSGAGTYKFGASISVKATIKEGYTWSQWTGTHPSTAKDYSFTMPAANVSNTATCTANQYTIVYNGNGSTGGTTKTSTHTYDVEKALTTNGYTRDGYTFTKWNTKSNGSGTSYNDGEIVLNLSSTSGGVVTLYAQWDPNKNTPYTVKHWQQNVDGDVSKEDSLNYTLKETENLTGTTDTSVTPGVKTYNGFTSPSKQTATIKGNGSLVINYYYTRNSYTVTLVKDKGTTSVSGAGTYLYGASVSINASVGVGYTWSKWSGTHSTTTQKYSFTMPASNVSNTANTTVNQYSISYDLAGGIVSTTNPTTYTVETTTFTLNNPTKVGYTFSGWTGSNGSTAQTTVTISKGSTGNKSYTANWTPNTNTKYVVKHWQQNLNGDASVKDSTNYTLKDTENLTGTTDITITPSVKTYAGFTSPTTQTVSVKADGSLVVNYYYTRKSYTVSLSKGTGISSVSGAGTYLFGASVTIDATIESGYTWSKWSGTHDTTTKKYSFTMPASNVSDTANTTINNYSITYDLGGGLASGNPDTYTVETATFTLKNPTKKGYTFRGWTGSNGTTPQTTVTITKGSTGNKSYKANWEATSYSISYDLNGGSVSFNPSSYTIDTATFTLNNPTKNGYTFKGWTGSCGTTPQTTVTIEKGSTGNKNYTANWEVNTYSITYDLAGGSVTGNPDSYTVETDTFTLKNPTRPGYTFRGWTGSNGSTSQTTVSITKGSTGDKSYKANWSAITYKITYNLAGGSVGTSNPSTYTVETDTFTLNNPTKVGYVFDGWTGSNGSTAQVSVSITKGSIGDKSYEANWSPSNDVAYVVKHWQQNVNGDALKEDSSNYTLKDTDNLFGTSDSSVTPDVKTYTGFKSPSTQTVTIKPDGSLVVNYYYTRKSYTVTLIKGTGISSVTGAGEYKFGASVSVDAVVSSGYTWSKWTGTSNSAAKSRSFSMPANDITDTANAVINNYSITYDLVGGSVSTANPTKYTVETETFTLNNPTKAGYVFKGWTGSNGTTPQKTVSIVKGSTGNKSYVANWSAGTGTPYKVKHWQQNLDGDASVQDSSNYTLKDTDNLTGTTGDNVTPDVKTYSGFTSPTKQSATITADGSLVVNYYYTRNSYTVTLTKGTGISSVSGAGTYKYGASVSIKAVVSSGYSWSKWTGTHSTTTQNYSFTMPASNVSDTANATINKYSITYDLDGGTVTTANPTTYTVETATFTLNNPTKVGYVFKGWTGSNGTTTQTTVSINKGSTGNKSYKANWSAGGSTAYKVQHWCQNLDGDSSVHDSANYTIKDIENLTGTTGGSVTPSVKSYSGFTAPSTQTVTIKADGSLVVNYYYTRNSYTVSLTKGTGITSVSGAGTYKFGESVTINAVVGNGYTWSKWTGSHSTTTQKYSFIMPASNVNDTATTTVNKYTISYNLDNGVLETANPSSYTIETATFTLNNPTKIGYTFTGWTGSNGSTPQKSVSISKGSTGDRSYTANWTANTDTTYKVQHWQQNLDGEASSKDSTNYTLKDTDNLTGTTGLSVTPSVKTYTGFTSPTTQTVTIKADGSLVVNYYYTRNSYTVTLSKGTGITSVSGAGTYLYGASVTINASVGNGYSWSKWSGTHNTTTQKHTFTMPATNVSDTANATTNSYTITYDLAGGTEVTANPTTYTVETETFTLNNPVKTGYEFTGWTGSNGTTPQTTVTIKKGSTGNKSYTTNWSANTGTPYKVQHWCQNLDGDSSVKDSANYTLKETENLGGVTGASITPNTKSYSGFTAPSKQTVTIKSDGSLVVK